MLKKLKLFVLAHRALNVGKKKSCKRTSGDIKVSSANLTSGEQVQLASKRRKTICAQNDACLLTRVSTTSQVAAN